MKHFLTTLIICCFLTQAVGQNQKNTFSSFEEFKSNTPSSYCDFQLKQRTNGNVFMIGGITNYRLKKIEPSTRTEQMTKEVWGVFVEGTTYINSYPYSKIIGYNKIIEKGYYSYFIGEPARLKEEQVKLGIINEGEKQLAVCCKSGFVILPNGQVKILKPEIMRELLKDNEDILTEFNSKDLKQENVYEMFVFLSRYNQMKK